jgi:thiamine-monophosphate kinase
MDTGENKKTSINSLGKFGLIDHITKKNKAQNESTVFGIGDDAAIIDSGN